MHLAVLQSWFDLSVFEEGSCFANKDKTTAECVAGSTQSIAYGAHVQLRAEVAAALGSAGMSLLSQGPERTQLWLATSHGSYRQYSGQ